MKKTISSMIVLICLCLPLLAQSGWPTTQTGSNLQIGDRLELAVQRAVDDAFFGTDNIKQRSRVAIIVETARDRDMRNLSSFLKSQLQTDLIHQEFVVIDPAYTDKIIEEVTRQNEILHYDQSTVVQIGQFVGAEYVCYAQITGSTDTGTRSLSLRVINVMRNTMDGSASVRF